MRLRHLTTLTLDVGDAPPDEFRIFRKGLNDSRKGPVLFDDVAARQVMAAYKQHGADLMIDLDHLSLDVDAPNYDGDARGWCQLEVRNGELWAVSVRWTSDGAARLTEKRQRYISPAFRIDTATKRPLFIHNVAITATPATDQLEPLVAASLADRGIMDLKKLIALLGLPEDATEEQVMAALEDLKKAKCELADDGKETPVAPEKKPEDDKAMSAVTERLASELVALRAELGANRVKEIIRENREKFTPALEAWALTQSPTALEKFVAAMPVLKDGKRHKEPGPGPGRGLERIEEVTLTAEEKKICRLTGVDPAKHLAHKIELRKRELEDQEV